ncbi:MAG: protein translocase subunit SecD [Brevinematia bacterium]
MGKLGRFIFLMLTVIVCLWVLMPTLKWYFFIPESEKNLLKLSQDELDTRSVEIKKKVMELKKIRQNSISLGLDLQGGVNLTLEVDEEELKKQLLEKYEFDEKKLEENFKSEYENALERGLEVLKNRMDQFGVAEPVIRKTFEGRISVELPGLNNPQLVRDALNRVGRLEFHIVDEKAMEELQRLGVDIRNGYVVSREKVPSEFKLAEDSDWYSYWENDQYGIPRLKGWYILKKKVELDGTMVKNARSDADNFGRPIVNFELTPEGGDIFAEVTAQNVKNRLAIVLDGRVKSAPVIQQEISGGRGQISGSFTVDETIFLANILKSGALPVKLKVAQERVIGPGLGKDSIIESGRAMLIGTILVILFMLIYYKIAGFIASITLAFNIFYLLALLAMVKATLTLSGIAGIALTVGMAVDANVIIYERIREEMRVSKVFRHALDNGFSHARATILDANITTIIAAVALYVFGSGTIKGFGITLLFGIVANIFAALFITRFLFDSWIDIFRPKKISI